MLIHYRQDQADPAYVAEWADRDGALIDFSDPGWTFLLELVHKPTGIIVLSKTTGIVGSATAPNIAVVWAVGELDVLDVSPDDWSELEAQDFRADLSGTLGGRRRVFNPEEPDVIRIHPTA